MEPPHEWRPIPEYAELYEVSDHGEIRRLTSTRGGRAGSYLTPVLNDRYVVVCLYKNKRARNHYLHRLVAAAFHGVASVNQPEVNHKNGIKTDNRVENLEYVTALENATHAGLLDLNPKGERVGTSKLTASEICAIRASSDTAKGIAPRFGIHWATVYSIRKRKSWKHL